MIQLSHINKAFQDKTILNDASLSLQRGEVVALVGRNGAGKTTLLTILLGELLPDSGAVTVDDESIGYVPQDIESGKTIAERFAGIDTWRRDYALNKVGLTNITPHISVSTLSGGQKNRLSLAKVLAADPEPTALLLDEPTNNLDNEGLEWLRAFIRNFRGSILLVSHDRTFINEVATKVVELCDGKLTQYGGNYDFYIEQKEAERQALQARYEDSIEERKRIEKGMRTIQNRARQGLRQKKPRDNDKAQFNWHQDSVQKSFSGQLKAVRSRLDQLQKTERPESVKSYKINLAGDVPSHKLIVTMKEVSKAYDARTVIHNGNLKLFGKERVRLIGNNGSGKTTFLKLAAGLLHPDRGTVTPGTNISIGYFSQDINGLDHEKTALENLESSHAEPNDIYREARSLGLGQSDLHKQVSALSRGQQAKVGFAKLLLGAHQLLILDEPTNHLDIPTREEIESALRQYSGAILFASHDTYFAQSLQPDITIAINREVE